MPNKDLVRPERVSVRQRVVDLLAGGAVGRGASSRCAPGRLHKPRSTAQECRLERDLELKTRFETLADRLLGQAISHVAVSQKSVSEIHVSPTVLCELLVMQTELRFRPDGVGGLIRSFAMQWRGLGVFGRPAQQGRGRRTVPRRPR